MGTLKSALFNYSQKNLRVGWTATLGNRAFTPKETRVELAGVGTLVISSAIRIYDRMNKSLFNKKI